MVAPTMRDLKISCNECGLFLDRTIFMEVRGCPNGHSQSVTDETLAELTREYAAGLGPSDEEVQDDLARALRVVGDMDVWQAEMAGLEDSWFARELERVQTFADAGDPSPDTGVIVTFRNGAAVRITVERI